MLKIRIVSVGKPANPLFDVAIDTYQRRLQRYVSLQWKSIASSSIKTESAQILKHCSNTTMVILLDERGQVVRSIDIANTIELLQNQSQKDLVFIIGGAFGVDESVVNCADKIWSFGAITLPHQIARLILVEQLYRSCDILAGGPYHHGDK